MCRHHRLDPHIQSSNLSLREPDLSNLELESVKRVRKALAGADRPNGVRELTDRVRNTAEMAQALGVELGAVVKTQVFTIGNRYVFVLVAGDHHCSEEQLPKIFQLQGDVVRPSADLVRAVTGFSNGGLTPVGSVSKLPTAIDASLKRFETIYAAAGHSQCIFETSVDELKSLTSGLVSYAVAGPAKPS